jgi:small subunit ribosomal protein S4
MERYPQIPGMHAGGRKKVSEYGVQLREKQKVKRFYGLMEGQFKSYYFAADRARGKTGETMLIMLEMRLDNIVYRMGIGASRSQARQIVTHGHITVNGKRVNIPSYACKAGDVVAIKENKREKFAYLKELRPITPKWLDFNVETLTGNIKLKPVREDIDLTIAEHLIVELYSK